MAAASQWSNSTKKATVSRLIEDRRNVLIKTCRLLGKDAAGIALEAINHARDSGIDVVMIDTAGRMQDNEPLMRALAKLIKVNEPDLVLFVGEALVGNEAVDQLVKFNQALADYSASTNPHTIDGIVLTKFDTIDDKVMFRFITIFPIYLNWSKKRI